VPAGEGTRRKGGIEPVEKRLLNVKEVAQAMDLSERTVGKLIRQGVLKSVLVGDRRLVSTRALDEFIANLEAEPKSEA
jgi:excisionase family DNA binding protein